MTAPATTHRHPRGVQELHHLPVHEVVLLLESDPEYGLEDAEVAPRQDRFGPNVLPRGRRPGPLARLALQFRNPLIYILVAAGTVTALIGGRVNASVIFGVVIINAAIGFIQESRAEQALESLVRMARTRATVVRSGRRLSVDSRELVPGDLVLLESGDRVPADLRLVSARELRADESALTGESLPVSKSDRTMPHETVVADRENLAFSGTLVSGGRGAGIVMSTAGDTELGRIHRLVGEAHALETPLTRQIAGFSRIISVVIAILAAFTFAVGVARGEPASEMFVAAVALAVGAIPEGLPAAVTITLAIGVSRMARRRAIVRKLPAVETLGSTTVICSDKTGTLTENQMTVQAVVAGGRRFSVEGAGYAPRGAIRHAGAAVEAGAWPVLIECLTAGALCNDARLREREGRHEATGDPTEAALLVAARKGGLDPALLASRRPRIDAIPFESEHQYMATLHSGLPGKAPVVYLKGAPERVLSRCGGALGPDGEEVALDPAAALAEAEQLAGEGLRVLAVARVQAPHETKVLERALVEENLTLLGFAAMLDPPRPEAAEAVAACRAAGIAVKMITGDHVETARAIAGHLRIAGVEDESAEPEVLSGAQLAELSGRELEAAAERASVFARVAPEQKLRLVEAFQARGHVVAMTGDGVNDAPALKRADIGVAMGVAGTEVAKEAADVVLTDDDFASIAAAVEEGRRVFDNLTKFIVWTLPTNMGEGLLILAAITAGATLPILPVQILWINMTTAVALGLMLAFEPKEPGIMARPPREPARPILSGELVGRILLVSGLLMAGSFLLFHWEQSGGASLAEARTAAMNVFVVGELFYLFNCRSLDRSVLSVGMLSNPWVTGGVLTTVGLQILITYAPFMQTLFHTAPLDVETWITIVAIGLCVYAAVGVEKWFKHRLWAPRRG